MQNNLPTPHRNDEEMEETEDAMIDQAAQKKVPTNKLGIKDQITTLEYEIAGKRRNLALKSQFISDFKVDLCLKKTGILSLFAKNEVDIVDPTGFDRNKMQVIQNLLSKMRRVRGFISKEQFTHLINGGLDVKSFLYHINPNEL